MKMILGVSLITTTVCYSFSIQLWLPYRWLINEIGVYFKKDTEINDADNQNDYMY